MEAAELLTTGWCPLNCTYCYIPKSRMMIHLHSRIRGYLQSGEFIEDLKRFYGGKLHFLGFWGTEPLLTLSDIKPHLPEIVEAFPNLEAISFSTSLLYRPLEIVDFAAAMPRKIQLRVQISVDGPAWITDRNRRVGAAEEIPRNFETVLRELNATSTCPVEFRWKVTHSIENIRGFTPERVRGFIGYFKRLNATFDRVNRRRDVTLRRGSFCPTIVVPGKYTANDGRAFARYLRLFHAENFDTSYTYRLRRIIDLFPDIAKTRMFTCSGGDSNAGVGFGKLHICHRTFYYDCPEYVESIVTQERYKNWDVSHFEEGTVDWVARWFITDDVPRFRYVMRGYHDFWRFKISYTETMVQLLAKVGEANPRYLSDPGFRQLFAIFENVALSCPMENLLNTGSIHLQTLSLIRMFANGAFEELVERCKRR